MEHHYCFCKKFAFNLAEGATHVALSKGCRKIAFTLAEVLITLAIVGVVAALVLPGVLTNIEKQKNLAVLKKAYSDLTTAIGDFDTEYECNRNFSNCAPNSGQFVLNFTQYLIEKHKYVYLNEVIKSIHFLYRVNPRTLTGSEPYVNLPSTFLAYDEAAPFSKPPYWLLAPNGSYIYIIQGNMGDFGYYINDGVSPKNNRYTRAVVTIITNPKKTGILNKDASKRYDTRYGREVFQAFVINNTTLVPNGSKKCSNGTAYWCNPYDCNPNVETQTNGLGCLSKIIEEGWQMNY